MQQSISHSLSLHLEWLARILDQRIKSYFVQEEGLPVFDFPPPPSPGRETPLDRLVVEMNMNWEERFVLILALVPHLRPQLLDILYTENLTINRGFTEFGGTQGKRHRGLVPTGETAVFLLAGQHLERRLSCMQIFRQDHFLFQLGILVSHTEEGVDPPLSAPLLVTPNYLLLFLWNEEYRPDFGPGFPAKHINTALEWEDLVLPPYILQQIAEIRDWVAYQGRIEDDWNLDKWLKPGYRSLFYGPPGTGKTLTTLLIGKTLERPVYRVDLSLVVSKYIGETEKNLARVFDLAERQDWILFFDEADALFGKRTETQSAHDRYANQEVSYLLQRLEDHPGLIILASNFKGNMDEAFIRRFQSMVHFPIPGPEQRLLLWQKAFSAGLQLAPDVDFRQLAEKFELTGGEIINVLRTVAIRVAARGGDHATWKDIMDGVRKEYRKNGRVF